MEIELPEGNARRPLGFRSEDPKLLRLDGPGSIDSHDSCGDDDDDGDCGCDEDRGDARGDEVPKNIFWFFEFKLIWFDLIQCWCLLVVSTMCYADTRTNRARNVPFLSSVFYFHYFTAAISTIGLPLRLLFYFLFLFL